MLTIIALITSSITSVVCILVAVNKSAEASYAQERINQQHSTIGEMRDEIREVWDENNKLKRRAELAEDALQSARKALSVSEPANEVES